MERKIVEMDLMNPMTAVSTGGEGGREREEGG